MPQGRCPGGYLVTQPGGALGDLAGRPPNLGARLGGGGCRLALSVVGSPQEVADRHLGDPSRSGGVVVVHLYDGQNKHSVGSVAFYVKS